MKGAGIAAVALAVLLACRFDRNFDSPYLPGNPDYAGKDWSRDGDGDGVADSVEKYAPGCSLPPRRCLENAKVLSALPQQGWNLAARNMLLWLGDPGRDPDLEWFPADASLRGYRLSSTDSSIVRIRDGKLIAAAAGTAQIHVSVPGMDALATSFIAKVAAQGKRLDSVSVPDIEVSRGGDTVPPIRWYPSDAAFKDYTLSSEPESVAVIVGRSVRGVAAGDAKVVLTALDGGRTAVFGVKVTNPINPLALSAEPLYLIQGGPPAAPKLTWSPTDASDLRYHLVMSEPSEAVRIGSDSQTVIPVSAGSALVLAFSRNGHLAAEFAVNVSRDAVPVTGISAQDMELVLGGDRQPPRLDWKPFDATDRRYTLVSKDPGVAVPSLNMIQPIGMGVADFVVTTLDGGYMAAFRVTVGLPDSSVHVDSVRVEPFSMPVGETRRVSPVWFPPHAGNREFSLSTADTGIVEVVGQSLRALGPGSAEVRLAAADGGRSAVFKVNVYAPVIPVVQVTVEPLSVYVGGSSAVSVEWTPSNATDLSYTLGVQDTNIAGVEVVSGVPFIRGKAVGATAGVLRSNSGPTASFSITVNAAPIKVASITLANFTLGLGDAPKDPAIVFFPSNATDKSYALSLPSGSGAVTLSQNKVVPAKAGKSPLTVTPLDNPSAAATCTVTVVSRVISVAAKDDTLRVGAADKPVAANLTWNPPDASDKSFSLKSNDTNIVRIAAGGIAYRGLAAGTTTVVVRALDGSGKADTFAVTVQVPVAQVIAKDAAMKTTDAILNPSSLLSWQPSNATNKNWSLAYASPSAVPAPSSIVAIVNGWQLQALAPGSARITVTASDNATAKDTFTVTVIQPVTGISASNVSMKVGDPDLAAPVTLSPSNASDKSFTLTSGNASIATAAGGKIHAVAGGAVNFTARSVSDSTKTVTFMVTVTVPVLSVAAADVASLRIGEGDKDPVLTWNPSNATNKGYTLASLQPSLLSIVSNKLHGLAPGAASAVVTAADGGKADTFSVAVIQPVTLVSVAALAMRKGDPDKDPVVAWTPANASNKAYVLSGGSAGIATVVGNKVHAVGSGSVILTLTSSDAGKTATFTVTVTVPVTGIQGSNLSLRTDDPDVEPDITVTPADATNRNWRLESDDPSVASIVNGTKIRAESRGDAVITVISDDNPAIKDTFTVSVRGALGF